MHTTHTEGSRPLVVNLVSETVDGSQGHGVHTAFIQTLTALRQAGCEVHVNAGAGCDIVHIETMGLASLKLLLHTRERAVVTAHIVPESLLGSFRFAPFWLPIGRAYMRAFYSLADEVLAVSPEVVEGLESLDLNVPVRMVPNAIDVGRFGPQPGWCSSARAELGIPDDEFVVVCAGQVQPRKGIHAFVETARAMPDVTFVWAGGMPFKWLTAHYDDMCREVAEAPANCRFIGEIAYDEMPRHLAMADCFLFPSTQETFGLAILEAAAAGLPLVLRDLPTYGPLFDDAYLTADESSFAGTIAALREEPGLREDYAGRAREMAWKFDTSSQGQMLLGVYEEVLSRPEEDRARAARNVLPKLQWAFGGRAPRR
jgi:1,2-diacylglycerol-3-alpha-glucose alpha-1,2-galactosyltransferase